MTLSANCVAFALVPQVSTLILNKHSNGRMYADKLYRVSVLGVQPAAFGTTKKASEYEA